MDRHARELRVLRLLQPFNEERHVRRRRQHVRVEVLPLDARGVGHEDPVNAERRDLRPEPAHHLGPGQRQQQIDPRARGNIWLEAALQRDFMIHRLHDGYPTRAVQQSDAHLVARNDLQYSSRVVGTPIRQPHHVRRIDLVRSQKNQIHVTVSATLGRVCSIFDRLVPL